jgi:hypothetical protein
MFSALVLELRDLSGQGGIVCSKLVDPGVLAGVPDQEQRREKNGRDHDHQPQDGLDAQRSLRSGHGDASFLLARCIHEFGFSPQEHLVSATKATTAGVLQGHMSRESSVGIDARYVPRLSAVECR